MAFTTLEQWRQMERRVRDRDIEIRRLVQSFFQDKYRQGGADLEIGDPTTAERLLTPAEKNQIRARVATLCNENSAEYLAAVAP
jgi:hypothetical protein